MVARIRPSRYRSQALLADAHEPDQRGYCRVHRANGMVEELRSKAAIDLAKGDIVKMFVGGGGVAEAKGRNLRVVVGTIFSL